MLTEKQQNKNIILALITLVVVIGIVALIGYLTLGKSPEYIQGQAEADEYRVSSKVPGRILELRVKEGQRIHRGDTLALLEAPDVMAKLEQAEAVQAAAQAQHQKAEHGTRAEQLQAAFELWQKAKAGLEIAEKSYNRVNRLFEGDRIDYHVVIDGSGQEKPFSMSVPFLPGTKVIDVDTVVNATFHPQAGVIIKG